MVSKNQLKLITQLQQKKYRNKHKLYSAEGIKVITELLHSRFTLHRLFTTTPDLFDVPADRVQPITEAELKKISRLTTPNTALALFEIPEETPVTYDGLMVALDAVNDPGNLGTIIRLCDWFGVRHLVCSNDTADCYNPKTVQASMGSVARVNVVYTELPEFLAQVPVPVMAADMGGDSVYTETLPEKAVLVMGSEAHGISENVLNTATKTLGIPRFGSIQQAESLNVAMATAILLNEFRR